MDPRPGRPERRRRRRKRGRPEKRFASREKAQQPRSWRENAPIVAIGVTVVLAPQLFGGVFPWAMWAIVALVVWTGWTLLLSPNGSVGRMSTTGKVMAAAVGLTAFQLVPLPAFLVELVSPRRHEALSRSLTIVEGNPPSWLPLSLDSGGTQAALLTAIAAFVGYVTGATLVQGGRRKVLLSIVAASSIAMAIMSALHAAVGLESVFGLYRPKHAHAHVLAPLMNQNHLAALLALGPSLCLGLALQTKRPPERLGWFLGAFLTGVMVPLTGSRGGMLGLLVSTLLLVAGMFWLRRRGRQGLGRVDWAVATAAIFATAAGGVFLGGDLISTEMAGGDVSKLAVGRKALGLAMSFPLLGAGRGAFGVAYLPVDGAGERFTHAESMLPHLTVEWGVPFAAVFTLVVLWAVWRAMLRARRMSAVAGIAAFTGLLAHEMVDFALELPAMAVVASVLLAACVERRERKEEPGRDLRRPIVIGATLVVLAVALLGLPGASYRAAERLEEKSESWAPSSAIPRELLAQLRAHPLEPALFLLAAHHRLRSRSAETPRWLNRAMELAPGWPGPHVLAGAWLARVGRPEQAALEFREAETRVPLAASDVLCAWAGESPREAAPVVLASAPLGDQAAVRFFERVRGCAPDQPFFRESIDSALLERDPYHPGAVRQRAARTDDSTERLALLRRALERHPDDIGLRIELANVYVADGSLDDAVDVLGESSPSEDVRILRLRARVALEREDEEGFGDAMLTLRGRMAASSAGLAEVHRFEGRLRERVGDLSSALSAFERASRLDPLEEDFRSVAELAERLGLQNRAERARTDACDRFRSSQACMPAGGGGP